MRLRPSRKNSSIRLLGRWADDHCSSGLDPIFPGVDPTGSAGILRLTLERLTRWYRLTFEDPTTALVMYFRLQFQREWVEEVHLAPRSPGPPSPALPWFFPSGEAREQPFRDPAPRGVGADEVQEGGGEHPGARGEGVRLADIEHGWGLDNGQLLHPDQIWVLPQLPVRKSGPCPT